MTAVLPELSPEILYGIYALMLLPILVVLGFEIAERIVARSEGRKGHTLLRPVLMGFCLLWLSIGVMISAPIADYFNHSSFHSELERELEVRKLVSNDDSEIEACTKELVDTKSFEVKWREKKNEYQGTLTLSPNGNDSCVYHLEKNESKKI